MKKHIKLIIFILSLLVIFGTYKLFQKETEKINYIALGDSIAEGMDPYYNIDYSYADYIKDYLKKKNMLRSYTKAFAKSRYKTQDLKYDIENNKTIEVDGKTIHLKEALRESDLVTLTIGANDFISTLTINNYQEKISDIKKTKQEADKIAENVKELIILIKQYAKNDIIVTGYYNPFPRMKEYKELIDEVVKYYNNQIEEKCNELGVKYVDIFDLFDNNEEALPNPINIHPNKYGYELIADKVIKTIEQLTK